MSRISFLLGGGADDDILADINTNKWQQLKNLLIADLGSSNDIAFASRPQTGIFATDCFQLLGNPYTAPWPGFRGSNIPLTDNQVNTNFGYWTNDGSVFTFTKNGVYLVNGSFGVGCVPTATYEGGVRVIIKLLLQYGTFGQEEYIEASSWQANEYVANFQSILGGQCTFSKTIKINSGQRISLIGERSRYLKEVDRVIATSASDGGFVIGGSSAPPVEYVTVPGGTNSDIACTGLSTGGGISNWMEIFQLRTF